MLTKLLTFFNRSERNLKSSGNYMTKIPTKKLRVKIVNERDRDKWRGQIQSKKK